MFRQFQSMAISLLYVAVASASVVYDNTGSVFTGSVAFTALEQGDQIVAAGTARAIRLLEIGVNQQGTAGTADLQARFYANDGSGGAPGTLLWASALFRDVALSGGNDLIPFAVPNVVVPDVFTWTVVISNASPIAAGLPNFGPASVGSSPDIAWFGSPGSWTTVGSPSSPVNYLARVTAIPEPATIFSFACGVACGVVAAGALRRSSQPCAAR